MESTLFNLTINDVQRRNRIINLLSDWGLVNIIKPEDTMDVAPLNQIKVLSYKDKNDWTLETKYNIGKKKGRNRIGFGGFTTPFFYGIISK